MYGKKLKSNETPRENGKRDTSTENVRIVQNYKKLETEWGWTKQNWG